MFDDAVLQVFKDEGGYFDNKVTGEVVNMGITLSFVRQNISPNIPSTYIQNLSVTAAKAIYKKYFWDRYSCDKLVNNSLAELLFYLYINQGPPTVIKYLQQICNSLGTSIAEDGIMGQQTIDAVNSLNAADVYSKVCDIAEARYKEIAKNSKLSGNLVGWLARLNRYKSKFIP